MKQAQKGTKSKAKKALKPKGKKAVWEGVHRELFAGEAKSSSWASFWIAEVGQEAGQINHWPAKRQKSVGMEGLDPGVFRSETVDYLNVSGNTS